MSEELLKIIKEMGMTEEMAISVLQQQKEILTGNYMGFGDLEKQIKEMFKDETFTKRKFMYYVEKGLIPEPLIKKGNQAAYGQKHVYNYIIAIYILQFGFSVEQALIIKNQLVTDDSNVVELIEVWEQLQKENIKNSDNKTYKALAMIAKGHRMIFGEA